MMNEIFYQSFVNREFEPLGLPKDYPVPAGENLAFYIQRSVDEDAVIYEFNYNKNNQLILEDPLTISWVKFEKGEEKTSELNQIQKRLAYGYTSKAISNDLIQFEFVCHPKKFFIRRNSSGMYEVTTTFGSDSYHKINNLYVYAEDFGVFTNVKFIEFYGELTDNRAIYYKMEVNS
jgi:hypothetical protein